MINFRPFSLFIFLPAVFNFLHWKRKSLLKVRANIGHHRRRSGVTNAISPAYVLHFMQQGSSPYVWWIIKGMQMGSSNNTFHERFRGGRDQENSQVKTTNILYVITVHSVHSFMETKRVCLFSLLRHKISLFWLKCLTTSHLREWKQKGFYGWTNSQYLYVYSRTVTYFFVYLETGISLQPWLLPISIIQIWIQMLLKLKQRQWLCFKPLPRCLELYPTDQTDLFVCRWQSFLLQGLVETHTHTHQLWHGQQLCHFIHYDDEGISFLVSPVRWDTASFIYSRWYSNPDHLSNSTYVVPMIHTWGKQNKWLFSLTVSDWIGPFLCPLLTSNAYLVAAVVLVCLLALRCLWFSRKQPAVISECSAESVRGQSAHFPWLPACTL